MVGEGGIRGRAFITGGVLPEIHRGKVFSGLMSVADWLPTYAAVAGVPDSGVLADIAVGPRPLDGLHQFWQNSVTRARRRL